MYNWDFYKKELKNKVSDKRYIHSINVLKEAQKLAENYGEDTQKAMLAGLLHDIAKEMSEELQIKILLDAGCDMDKFKNACSKIFHGFAGSEYIKNKFGITDEDILNAVRYHTVGRKNMSMLEKIIFVSDYISAERDFPDTSEVRALAYKDLDAVVLHKLSTSMQKCINSRQAIYPNTVQTYNQLVLKRSCKAQ